MCLCCCCCLTRQPEPHGCTQLPCPSAPGPQRAARIQPSCRAHGGAAHQPHAHTLGKSPSAGPHHNDERHQQRPGFSPMCDQPWLSPPTSISSSLIRTHNLFMLCPRSTTQPCVPRGGCRGVRGLAAEARQPGSLRGTGWGLPCPPRGTHCHCWPAAGTGTRPPGAGLEAASYVHGGQDATWVCKGRVCASEELFPR